jgi:hypothetical protein
MARVGRGFAQIISDEKEGIEGKVVRMLRGGLSTHIKDYWLKWDGRPTKDQSKTAAKGKSTSTLQRAVEGVRKKISLFNKQAETEAPISSGSKRVDGFAGLPDFVVPTILQALYKLPPLFPFSRTTAYVILAGKTPPPSSVWLRGTTPSGDELELEIPIQVLPDSDQTIHQLAARKMLQELKEGTGYIHSGNYSVNKEMNPGTFDDWADREGIRLGVKYSLASKWTSFVAVQKQKKAKEAVKADEKQEETDERKADVDADADEWTDINSVMEVGDYGYPAGDQSTEEALVDQIGGAVAYTQSAPLASPGCPSGGPMFFRSATPSAPMPSSTHSASRKQMSSSAMGLPSPAQPRKSVGGGGRSGAFLSTASSHAHASPPSPPAAKYAPPSLQARDKPSFLCSDDLAPQGEAITSIEGSSPVSYFYAFSHSSGSSCLKACPHAG